MLSYKYSPRLQAPARRGRSMALASCLVVSACWASACDEASRGPDGDFDLEGEHDWDDDEGGAQGSGIGDDGNGSAGDLPTNGTAGGDDGGEIPQTENEQEGEFQVPRASGRFVYSSSPKTHRLAIIDSADLVVDVVDVGLRPTSVVSLPAGPDGSGGAIVLNADSHDISIVHTPVGGVTRVEQRPVTAVANAIVVSPTYDYVGVYHDVDVGSVEGGGSDQDLSLVALAAGGLSHALTVGSHPSEFAFAPGGRTAYVVSDDGVNVIDMNAVEQGMGGKPPLVPVTDDPGLDPKRVEVVLAVQRGQAIARIDGERSLFVTDLATRQQLRFDLPAVPTDIDLTPDGDAALLVLPNELGSQLVRVQLPATGPESAISFPLGERYVGQVEVAPDLSALVLHTSQNPWEDDPAHEDPRQRITIARPGNGAWDDLVTLFVEFPVRFAGISPDAGTALTVHARDPASVNAPWSYTLVDLTQRHPVKKLQRTQADPGAIMFVEDGSRAAVLLRDDRQNIARVDVVNLGNFVVEGYDLGAPPTSVGHVPATDRIFVAQEHDAGRISFIDAAGELQTLTGFELNDSIKD